MDNKNVWNSKQDEPLLRVFAGFAAAVRLHEQPYALSEDRWVHSNDIADQKTADMKLSWHGQTEAP
jgi:hypothetical protein